MPDTLKKDLSSAIQQHLLDRFDGVEGVRILAQVTLLDPRYKNRFFHDEAKKNVLACLNKELKEEFQRQHQQNANKVSIPEPSAKQKKKSALWESCDTEDQGSSNAAAQAAADTKMWISETTLSFLCNQESQIHLHGGLEKARGCSQ